MSLVFLSVFMRLASLTLAKVYLKLLIPFLSFQSGGSRDMLYNAWLTLGHHYPFSSFIFLFPIILSKHYEGIPSLLFSMGIYNCDQCSDFNLDPPFISLSLN